MGDITLDSTPVSNVNKRHVSCPGHSFSNHRITVLESGECDAVSETVDLSSAVKLVFSGANADGFDASIAVRLTGEAPPSTLVAVAVKVYVEGRSMQRRLEARPMLRTEFRWDGLDAYGRPVFGASTVRIEAGYEYADCPETVVIEKTAIVDARAPKEDKIFKWSLDFHHRLEPRSMKLYLGTGEVFDLDGVGASFELKPLDFDASQGHANGNGHRHGDEAHVEYLSAWALAHDGFRTTFIGTEDAIYEWKNESVRAN